MKKETLRKVLDEKLEGMSWSYTFEAGEKVVLFRNVETESRTEKQFLDSLKAEGSERMIDGSGEVSTKIERLDGKLRLTLFHGDNVVEEGEEIKEREALRIFRESKKESNSRGLGGLFDFFRGGNEPSKELVPNSISVEFDRIEDLELKDDGDIDSLELIGTGFKIEFREDGGCSIRFGETISSR